MYRTRDQRRVPEKRGEEDSAEPVDHALGRSRGGFDSKLHMVSVGNDVALAIGVSAAQQHESKHFASMLDMVSVPGKQGRRIRRPHYVVGDKGYSSAENRAAAKRRRIVPVIARRSNEACDDFFN